VTLLASLPGMSQDLRSTINRNLTDIMELHDEILGELHRVIPNSEYTQLDVPQRAAIHTGKANSHHRWRSLDAVPENENGLAWLHAVPGMIAEPQVAGEVARIFAKRVRYKATLPKKAR
jgi:hypothetical protein